MKEEERRRRRAITRHNERETGRGRMWMRLCPAIVYTDIYHISYINIYNI